MQHNDVPMFFLFVLHEHLNQQNNGLSSVSAIAADLRLGVSHRNHMTLNKQDCCEVYLASNFRPKFLMWSPKRTNTMKSAGAVDKPSDGGIS